MVFDTNRGPFFWECFMVPQFKIPRFLFVNAPEVEQAVICPLHGYAAVDECLSLFLTPKTSTSLISHY